MQLKRIDSGWDAWRRYKNGERIYTKIFGTDAHLCDHKWEFDDFINGHFKYYEGVELPKKTIEEFVAEFGRESLDKAIAEERYAVFNWLEMTTLDNFKFEINLNDAKLYIQNEKDML